MEVNGQFHAPASLLSCAHLVGAWIETRDDPYIVDKKKSLASARNWTPGHPSHNMSLYRLSYPGLMSAFEGGHAVE
jgi:hypothetical protein